MRRQHTGRRRSAAQPSLEARHVGFFERMNMNKDIESNKLIEQLYFEMYHKLFLYAQSALRDHCLAEEAVQETFRIACAKADRLAESENRQGWLINTLKFVIRNTLRNQTKLKNLLLAAVTMMETSPGISERDVNWEMYCTSVLGEEDFELLKRIAIENRTMLEASSELGISVETCKKRIQRAKKKLKDSITKNFL